jgi:signal transduction histidine kinase
LNLTLSEDVDSVTASLAEKLGTDKLALVPMVSKGHLLGLLAADNKITGHPISDEAVQLLQVLANQAAVAMERARLYEVQRERRCELERINKLLAESQNQIIKFEKMSVIGELTSAIAHELRNPLTVVGGFANLMLKSELPDENREYLNIITAEIKRAESVLHQVLDFSQASKGDNQKIDFSRLVQRSMELMKGRFSGRELPMFLSLANPPLMVFGNYDQLAHAVYQLLKFVAEDIIPPGDVEVRTELKDDRAVMFVKIRCQENDSEKIRKTMQRTFSQSRTSQHLTILVAGETVRYHGGNLGVINSDESMPSLYIELPLMKELQDETTHTGS